MHNKISFNDFKVVKISGGDLLRERPLFCNEGKNLAVSNRETCHLYSTSTGEHLSQLFSCDAPIISLQLNPNNHNQIIAVTETGSLTKFFLDTENEAKATCKLKLLAGMLGQKYVPKFSSNKQSISYDDNDPNVDWHKSLSGIKFFHAIIEGGKVFASWCAAGEYYAHISTFNLSSGEQIADQLHPKIGYQKCSQNFGISNDVIVAMSTDFVHVTHLTKLWKKKHLIGSGLEITCIALCNEESMFATGDTQGKIVVWRNIFEKRPLKDVYHWHTLPVRSLTFTDYGAHMLSGGEENVLVKWSLSSQMKTFLPRLSSSIHHLVVAPGTPLFSVSTADSRIQIINLNLKLTSTIQHFSRCSSLTLTEPSKILTQDPRTEALVLGGRTGHLQFLSSSDGGRFLYTLDVTNRNFLTRERRCLIENVEVRFAVFTRCGRWLITAESGANEARLKFWQFIGKKQEFSLNTDVDAPHGSPDITCLEVSSDELVVTCGPDEQFRLWGVVESVHLQQVRLHWAQLGVGGYRGLPVSVASFARDSSLVGVGFGPALTVWDTDSTSFKCSLTPPLKRSPVKHIHFGNQEVSHLVVSGTDSEIVCWNLVTLCMQWVVPLNVVAIISDPSSPFMCAISKKNGLFMFNPASAHPEFRLEKVCDSDVITGLFVTKTEAPFLYFLTSKQELFCFGEEVQPKMKAIEVSKFTPFTSQLAQMTRKDVIPAEEMSLVTAQPTAFPAEILNMPAHHLPSVALLCKDVLRSLLVTVPVSEKNETSNEDDIVVLEASNSWKTPSKSETDLQRVVDTLFGGD